MTVSLLLAGNGNAFPFPLLVKRNDEMEAHFSFHVHLLPKQKHVSISLFRESEMETHFRFRLSVVNSAENDPANMGRVKLPATCRFAHGQKRISTKLVKCSAYRKPQHKTQPQHTTANMSSHHPTLQQLCSSLSMARAKLPPNHCAAAPLRVCAGCEPSGWRSPVSIHLFGVPKWHPSKKRERDRA
jgi:hypothetical protein